MGSGGILGKNSFQLTKLHFFVENSCFFLKFVHFSIISKKSCGSMAFVIHGNTGLFIVKSILLTQ